MSTPRKRSRNSALLGQRPATPEAPPTDTGLAEARQRRDWRTLRKTRADRYDPSHVNLDCI